MKKLTISILLLLFAAFPPTLLASEASHRKAAEEYIESVQSKRGFDLMISSLEDMLSKQFQGIELSPEKRMASIEASKATTDMFRELFVWEEMRKLYIDIYIQVFSEKELRELTDFYHSPLGKKVIAKMPELMKITMELTQKDMMKKMPMIMEKLQARRIVPAAEVPVELPYGALPPEAPTSDLSESK